MAEPERTDLAPGYSISRIINGCWQLTPDHGGGPGDDKKIFRIFSDLVDHGFTTFDCADIYIGVEELIGRFRASLPDPHSIQIHTKYAANRDSLADLTTDKINDAIDRSLRRLGVDCIDLMQFHWWNYDVAGLEMLVETMVRARRAGKIRCLGLTNFDTSHVRAIEESGAGVVSLQSQYSMLDRRPEREMTDYASQSGVRLLPYGVLAGGFLSDRYLGDAEPTELNRSLIKYRLIIDEAGGWEAYQQLLSGLRGIADKHDVDISAVATRWVLDQRGVAAVMLGVGHCSRAGQNARIAGLELDADDRHEINRLLARLTVPPGDMYDLERDMEGRHAKIIKMNLHDHPANQ